MANTLNLGDGNWGVKDSSLLGYRKDGSKFLPETFDVTRASGGTRVNKSGLIETPTEILSGELIINGDFSNGSNDWDLSGGSWTIANGVATFDGLNNAKRIFQSVGFVQNKNYKISFDVTQTDDDFISLFFGQNATQLIETKNYKVGSYEFYAEASVTTENLSIYAYNTTYGGGSIDNVSIIEINQDNLARIDYSDGVDGVLLTEPQSTNLITDSGLSNWSVGRTTINQSANTSPSGDNNAIALVATAVNDDHFVSITPSFPLGEVTYSVFAKAADKGWIRLWDIETNVWVNFNITNGVVGNTFGSLTDTSIKDYGNGWYRCSMTYSTLSASSKTARVYAIFNDSAKNYLGDGVTEDVYLWGAQLEALSYPTSYIPTYGAIASRSGDLVTNGGDVNNFNSEEGTFFVEIEALVGGVNNRYFSISDGTANNRIQLVLSGSSTSRLQITSSSFTAITHDFVQTDNNKIAVVYSALGAKLFVNGSLVGSNTDNASFPTDSLSVLDLALYNQTTPFYGKTKNVQVFNEALSDAELQTLTTI